VCVCPAGTFFQCLNNLFAVVLSDLVVVCLQMSTHTHTHTLRLVLARLGSQERPNVPVRRRGLREEFLRATAAAGPHEDAQRRQALHLQGEELRQEVHHGRQPEEPPARTHRWGEILAYKGPRHAGGENRLGATRLA